MTTEPRPRRYLAAADPPPTAPEPAGPGAGRPGRQAAPPLAAPALPQHKISPPGSADSGWRWASSPSPAAPADLHPAEQQDGRRLVHGRARSSAARRGPAARGRLRRAPGRPGRGGAHQPAAGGGPAALSRRRQARHGGGPGASGRLGALRPRPRSGQDLRDAPRGLEQLVRGMHGVAKHYSGHPRPLTVPGQRVDEHPARRIASARSVSRQASPGNVTSR